MHGWLRAIIQLLYFLFLPSAYTAAFAGVKYIFTQLGAGEKIGLTSFVSVLIVLCLYTIVFGRFFCGFACAFGSFGDAVHFVYVWICKKIKKKPVKLPETVTSKLSKVKYVVLAVIVLLCFKGVYSQTQGYSPWDVFSMLHAFNFKLGGYLLGIVLLVLIMVGMALQERFFCRFLCPMGAVFSLLPMLPFFTLKREREQCIKGCSACTKQWSVRHRVCRRPVRWMSAVTVSSARSVLTLVRVLIFTADCRVSKVMKLFLLLSEH